MTDEWDWFDSLPSSAQEELVAKGRELDRLRAENAAMRPIVEAVAQTGQDPFGKISEAGPYTYKCPFCLRNIGDFTDQWDSNAGRHSKTCLVLQARQARALLAKDQTTS